MQMKQKNGRMGPIQMKNRCASKEAVKSAETWPREREEIFTNHECDKGLVPGPDKELLTFAGNDESPALKPGKGPKGHFSSTAVL